MLCIRGGKGEKQSPLAESLGLINGLGLPLKGNGSGITVKPRPLCIGFFILLYVSAKGIYR